MASAKGTEQALIWLRSKMNEGYDTLEGINAEVCYNVILDLKDQITKQGCIIYNLKKQISNKGPSRDEHV